MRKPSIGVHLRLSVAVLCLFATALGQESLKQIETRAAELKARGDAAGSLAEWEKAAAIDPKSARIQHEIGFLLAVLQRQSEAIQHLQRAIDLDPRLAIAQYHLGVAYWLQQDPANSIPHLQSAVALEPRNFEYRFHLGHALSGTSQYAAALPQFQAAIEINPKHAEAWDQLGLVRQHTGD